MKIQLSPVYSLNSIAKHMFGSFIPLFFFLAHVSVIRSDLEINCFDSVPPKVSTHKGERPHWPSQSNESSDSCQNLVLTVPHSITSKMEQIKSPTAPQNWNPMKDEFNDDSFNSYDTGLSGNMTAKKGNQEFDRNIRQQGFQIYVSGIPTQMTQEGLTNLFSRAGKVVSCKICKSNQHDSDSTYGFVGMSKVSELSTAHTIINNYKVGNHTLKLRVAKDTERYLKEKDEMPDNTFHFSGGESQSSSRSPRRMDNRYGSRERSSSEDADLHLVKLKESGKLSEQDLKKPYIYRSLEAMVMQVKVEDNRRMVQVTDKPLVLRTDSTQLAGTLGDVVIKVSGTGLSLGELEPDDLKNVSAQIQRSRHSSSEQVPKEIPLSTKKTVPAQNIGQKNRIENSSQANGPCSPNRQQDKATAERPKSKVSGSCLNCGRPGTSCCSVCKGSYCTRLCQQKHWPSHKLHCKAISARLEVPQVPVEKCNYVYLKDLEVSQPEKEELKALTVHVVSPDEIWLQFVQVKSKQHFTIICSMTNIYEIDNNMDYHPKVGTLCAARADDEWYRGVVLEIKKDNIVSIRFIDYGDVRDIHVKDIRLLNEQFTKIPVLARQCSLADIQPFNGKWSPQATQYLSQMLVDKQCSVKLKSVENGVLRVIITTTAGVCVNQHLIDENLAQKPTLPMTLPSVIDNINIGQELEVLVTAIDSVSAIYLTLKKNALLMMKQQEALMNRYSILPSNKTYSPQVGEICAAKFVDDYWYRGCVVGQSESNVEILYVDYGNKATIPKSDCHPLLKDFLDLDRQGMTCSLASSTGSHEEVMQSLKQLEGQQVKVHVMGKTEDGLKIEFDDNLQAKNQPLHQNEPTSQSPSTPVKQESLNKFQQRASPPVSQQGVYNGPTTSQNNTSPHSRGNHGSVNQQGGNNRSPGNYRNNGQYCRRPVDSQSPPMPVMAADCQKISLTKGKMETGMIVVANGPSNFYIQINDQNVHRALVQISEPMSNDYNNIKEVHLPIVGELCIAKFSDDCWYRAEVLSIGTNRLNVKFVDYGNVDPVRKEDIRRIREPYSKIPIAAIRCGLAGVQPSDNVEDKNSQQFVQKFLNQVVDLKAVGVNEKDVYLLEVFDKKGSNRPINEDFLTKTTPPQTIGYRELQAQCVVKVAVVFVVNPSEFYCTRVDDMPRVIQHQSPPSDDSDEYAKPKTLLISDSMVRDVKEEELEKTTVECLRGKRVIDIKHRLQELPVHEFSSIIIHASTNDCTSVADEKFAEFIYDGLVDDLKTRAPDALIAFSTVLPRIDDASFQVHIDKLNDNLRRLSAEKNCVLIDNDENFRLKGDVPDITTVDRYGLHLSQIGTRRLIENIDRVHSFIRKTSEPQVVRHNSELSRSSDILALQNLMENLNAKYANRGENSSYVPTKGEMCCSIFADDQSWYRALVLDINHSNQSLSVQYVDYGNKEEVSFASVHPLDKEFLSDTPCLAIKCSVTGTQPGKGNTWSQEDIERFKEVTGNGQKAMDIKLLSCKNGCNHVEFTDPSTNEVIKKSFQNVLPPPTVAEMALHDTPLTSHRPIQTPSPSHRPVQTPSPSTDTEDLRAKYEAQQREIENLKQLLLNR